MQLFWAKILDERHGILPPDEARHCLKVLRHGVGDSIHCFDGAGTMYAARIARIAGGEVYLDLIEASPGWGEHGRHLCLAVSPLRLRDRFEWLVEKAVELGATEIVPVLCQHTDKYKARFKPERLETLILTATKQCLRAALPPLHPPVDLTTWLAQGVPGTGLIAQAGAAVGLASFPAALPSVQRLCILIGPEGDFSPEEMATAQAAGFLPVHLGHTRLRTETAGVHALSLIKAAWGY